MSKKKGAVKRLDKIFSEIGMEYIPIPKGDEISLIESISFLEGAGGSLQMQDSHAPLETCETHGKVCYSSVNVARNVIKKRRKHDSGPLREYRCPDCGFYHISSSI